MSATSTSRAHRIVTRITTAWTEMGDAQRRMVEIQTGITGLTTRRGRKTRVHADDHDAQL